MKRFLKDISPFNNRTEMPAILYVAKIILITAVVLAAACAALRAAVCSCQENGRLDRSGECSDPKKP